MSRAQSRAPIRRVDVEPNPGDLTRSAPDGALVQHRTMTDDIHPRLVLLRALLRLAI